MNLVAGIVVVAIGVFQVGLAVLIVTKPQLAERFLRSFASSPRAHYTEQVLRLIAGASVVEFAPSMWYPNLFKLFGWLLIVPAVALLLLPWQWHEKFAKLAMPLVFQHLELFALGAFALGVFIIYALSRVVL